MFRSHYLTTAAISWCMGIPAVAADQPSQQADYAAQSIARVLSVDVTPGKTKLDLVQNQYQQALSTAPRDARLEYAYSLILQRMFKSTEAREHLNRSLEIDPAFVPANQAVIRELLKARQFTEAGERIAEFASRLDAKRGDSPDSAEWLGRIVNCVIVAIGTPDAQSQFSYLDRRVRPTLPPLLLARYEKGFNSLEQDLERLSTAVDEARSTAQVKRDSTKARVDADLVKDQEQIKQKLQTAQKTKEKWDEWIEDQTSKADDLLKEQEKRYQELENAATVQQTAVAALRLALDRFDRQLVPQQTNTGNISSNRASLEVQLSIEEQRLASIFDRQTSLSNQAAQTVATRKAAVAQYQQATGVALKEAANLDRWEKRNKSIADNMKKAAEKKPTQVATLEARIKSLNTWDPSDFDSEKRRLLADLGIVENEAKPPASGPGVTKTANPRP